VLLLYLIAQHIKLLLLLVECSVYAVSTYTLCYVAVVCAHITTATTATIAAAIAVINSEYVTDTPQYIQYYLPTQQP
jgi:hypothetical protein